MPKRALIALAVLGLVTTACVSSSTPPVDFGQGARFVPFVVDSTDDMGQGSAVAFTADGLPYLAYFGFPEELAEGEIATPRPFGSPAVPGVMLATASADGMWERGAVDTTEPAVPAAGVSVPFGPVETPDLDLTPANANGTAVAVADDGTVHVAWTMGAGVYHATTKLGGTSSVEQVFDLGVSVAQAGPIGRPDLTLDDAGDPWIAFMVETSGGREVHVAHPDGEAWADDVAASTALCNGCPAPQPTGIGVVGGAATVVYADAAANEIRAARLDGKEWADAGATKGSGLGLSFATDGERALVASYGEGAVELATWSSDGWTAADVAELSGGEPAPGRPTTAVAVDGAGTIYVAWADAGLHLSSGTESFAPVDLGHTVSTGAEPALAASEAGVALSWYETVQQNLMVGFLGDLQDVLIAQPSPSLTVAQGGAAPGEECGADGKIALDLVAKGTLFDVNCLVAPAGEKFTISLDNQDAGIPHNVNVMDQQGGTSIAATELAPGVVQQELPMEPLDEGVYFFQCDAHPTTMTGQLAVVKGAK